MQTSPDIITRDVSVFRSAFEGQELEQLALEIDELWDNWPGKVSYPGEGLILSVTDTLPLANTSKLTGSVLQKVVEVCDIPEDAGVGLNTYAKNAEGPFHTHTESRATIVHPTGGGAYDIAPNAPDPNIAKRNFMRLDVGAGDIVLSSGKILHRGANLSDAPRRNLVFLHD